MCVYFAVHGTLRVRCNKTKDRDFLEVFAGQCAVSHALRDVYWFKMATFFPTLWERLALENGIHTKPSRIGLWAPAVPRKACAEYQWRWIWTLVCLTWPRLRVLCFLARAQFSPIFFCEDKPRLHHMGLPINPFYTVLEPIRRLTVNEILRCKPGSLVLFAPVCKSFSRMFLAQFLPRRKMRMFWYEQ